MDDEQIKKALKEIMSQISPASSLAELVKASTSLNNLSNLTDSPEILNQIKDAQVILDNRVQETEKAQASQNISSGKKGHNDGDKDKDLDLDKLAAENDKIYAKFLLTHKKDLSDKIENNKKLSKLAEASKAGNPISEADKNNQLKTDEQIKVAQRRHQEMLEAEKRANAEVEACEAELKKLRSKLAVTASPEEREGIRVRMDLVQERRAGALKIVAEVQKQHNANREEGRIINESLEASKKSGVDQEFWNAKKGQKQKIEKFSGRWSELIAETEKNVALGGRGHAEQSQSQPAQKEVVKTQKERTENPEEAAMLMNAFKKHPPTATPSLQTSKPLSPPVTPKVNGPASKDIGHGGGRGRA